MADENGLSAPIDSNEIGTFAAHLLLLEDSSAYHAKKYTMNGPVDITGRQIVDLVEEKIGEKVHDVSFRDMELLDAWAARDQSKAHLIMSIKRATETSWTGLSMAKDSSPEFSNLLEQRSTPSMVLERSLET